MLERWSEPGLGEHIVESLHLAVETEEEFIRIQKELAEIDLHLKKYGIKISLSKGKEERYIFRFDISLDRLKRDAGKKETMVLQRKSRKYFYSVALIKVRRVQNMPVFS